MGAIVTITPFNKLNKLTSKNLVQKLNEKQKLLINQTLYNFFNSDEFAFIRTYFFFFLFYPLLLFYNFGFINLHIERIKYTNDVGTIAQIRYIKLILGSNLTLYA